MRVAYTRYTTCDLCGEAVMAAAVLDAKDGGQMTVWVACLEKGLPWSGTSRRSLRWRGTAVPTARIAGTRSGLGLHLRG
jgi:hypothetical protein